MYKKVIIFYFLVLGFQLKSQNWTPLDTGIHSYIPYGLLADNQRGNLFAFGVNSVNGINVWKNNKWEVWYPTRDFATYGDEVGVLNNKIIFFKKYYENNNPSLKRIAILEFTDNADLDTIKIIKNHDWLPFGNKGYNGKLILFSTVAAGVNSIATFDGDTIIPIGDASMDGFLSTCEYKGDLYAIGKSAIAERGVFKKTPTSWQLIYKIQGSMSQLVDMVVYNNRLYIYGGIYLVESATNLGNGIIAYDGVNFDTLQGGVLNTFNLTNGPIMDVSVCNNKLFVTGNFNKAGGAKARGIAYWNDTTWCTMHRDLDSTGNFFRIETFQDTIYEVAEFVRIYNNTDYGWISKLSTVYSDTCSASRFTNVPKYNFEDFEFFPNPTSDNITVKLPGTFILSETRYIITNLLGQEVFTENPTSYYYSLNLSSLSQGVYHLTIKDNQIQKTVKIIKN